MRFRTTIQGPEAKKGPYRTFNFLLRRATDIKTHPKRARLREEKKKSAVAAKMLGTHASIAHQ